MYSYEYACIASNFLAFVTSKFQSKGKVPRPLVRERGLAWNKAKLYTAFPCTEAMKAGCGSLDLGTTRVQIIFCTLDNSVEQPRNLGLWE